MLKSPTFTGFKPSSTKTGPPHKDKRITFYPISLVTSTDHVSSKRKKNGFIHSSSYTWTTECSKSHLSVASFSCGKFQAH